MAELHDTEVDDYYADCLAEIPAGGLEAAALRVVNDMAYFGEKAADAIEQETRAEVHRKSIAAETHRVLSITLEGKGGKPPSDTAIKIALEGDPEYGKACISEGVARAHKARMQNRYEVMRSRRNMIEKLIDLRLKLLGRDPLAGDLASAPEEPGDPTGWRG